MSKSSIRVVAALVLAGLAASPVAAANKEHQQLMADIRMLQEQSQQLQNLIGSVAEALTQALKVVNARLDEQNAATRKAFADQKLVIDNLSGDVRVIRERLDDNNVRVSSLTQELEALRQSMQQLGAPRSSVEADPFAIGADAPQTGGAPPPAATPPPVPGGTSPTKLYDMANADYFAGQYELAVQGFESYIRSFAKSDMADNAQVNIGNAYLQAGKNDKAVEAYDKAIRTYASGDAIPEAYFKMGIALQNLRELDRARETWELCVKTFPDSTAALQSKQRLDQLKRP